jgi:hypothetical protein
VSAATDKVSDAIGNVTDSVAHVFTGAFALEDKPLHNTHNDKVLADKGHHDLTTDLKLNKRKF